MTIYQIEVRAISEVHDTHAHQLAREILHLPTRHLPSLAAISSQSASPDIHSAQLYYLTGNLSSTQIAQLTNQLLVDAVVQKAVLISPSSESEREHLQEDAATRGELREHSQEDEGSRARRNPTAHVVDVFFHPGVTDTLAESVLAGAKMLGMTGLEQVETGRRYILDSRLSEADAHTIAQELLYNPVIQHYQLYPYHAGNMAQRQVASLRTVKEAAADSAPSQPVLGRTIPISDMSDEQLLELSRAGLLALNREEMRAIQQHFRAQGREPTDVELETLAQTWSEHCSHKTFKATIDYREVDSNGFAPETETIKGLLKSYIMRATEQVRPDWLVSAFSDNAGIIRFTDTLDIAFKVETHNHPSAIEPFGGANTGVGGVIRDVLGVSAQPIACTDILCFGPLETSPDELPTGILPPRRIAGGVVNGIRDYGNKMGIPVVNGAILYHRGYLYNPLVFCGCLGILPHDSHPNKVEPGDLIVALGGRTGRDGIHGATFSSGEMSSETNAQAGSAVQIGAPITEKKVADVIVQARDRELYHAITDCGAGGFSSAVGEMGAETGVRVELSQAPLKYQGLLPWEIWLSEAQERMVLAVPAENLTELREICAIEEVELSVIGVFTDDHRLTVTYYDKVVADMDMTFLHDGRPERSLEAIWLRSQANQERPVQDTTSQPPNANLVQTINRSLGPTLLALLHHPTIASKEEVVRRYDHEVQGATVLKPLVGKTGHGPGDAAVLQPVAALPDQSGIVLANGINPLLSMNNGQADPYHMALNMVDEALRNLTAVGGDIARTALLDNFCWGNPTDPLQLGMLVRAVKGCHAAAVGFGIPFISGKDSLNNEYRAQGQRLPVIPTLLISAVGIIENVAQTIDMSLKMPGNLLYLVGSTRNELAGSHYAEVVDQDSFAQLFSYSSVPQVDIVHARTTMQSLGEAIRSGLVRSCHDLSEGGLAVAAAEMSLASALGLTLDIAHVVVKNMSGVTPGGEDIVRIFSESPSRFLVEITPEQLGAFEKHMRNNKITNLSYVGTVSNTDRFIVRNGEEELINLGVEELQAAWKGSQA